MSYIFLIAIRLLSFAWAQEEFLRQYMDLVVNEHQQWIDLQVQNHGDHFDHAQIKALATKGRIKDDYLLAGHLGLFYIEQEAHQYNQRYLFDQFMKLLRSEPERMTNLLGLELPEAWEGKSFEFWKGLGILFSEINDSHDHAKLRSLTNLRDLYEIYNQNHRGHPLTQDISVKDHQITEQKMREVINRLSFWPEHYIKKSISTGIIKEISELLRHKPKNLQFFSDLFMACEIVADQHERHFSLMTAEEMKKTPESMALRELRRKVEKLGESALSGADFRRYLSFQAHITLPLQDAYSNAIKDAKFKAENTPGRPVEEIRREMAKIGKVRRFSDLELLRKQQVDFLSARNKDYANLRPAQKIQILWRLQEAGHPVQELHLTMTQVYLFEDLVGVVLGRTRIGNRCYHRQVLHLLNI